MKYSSSSSVFRILEVFRTYISRLDPLSTHVLRTVPSKMRNLRNIRYSSLLDSPAGPLTSIAWDAGTDTPICTQGPSEEDQVITLLRSTDLRELSAQDGLSEKERVGKGLQKITSWEVPAPSPSVPVDKVLCLQYFADDQTTCLVFAGGDIVTVKEHPLPGEDDIVIVGSVDPGIAAAKWSPDEGLLAVATKAASFLLMSRHFEVVGETATTADDLKSSKHVSIGWGRVETQFKGKRAKALRDPTVPEKVDEGRLSPYDQGHVSISWRGDGAFVALSSIEPDERRVIRVYDRECSLDSVSEPVDGLEAALSWRPAGNLIASIQRFEDRIDVVFFERNGLRHGQFDLRVDQQAMKTWASNISLDWNIDSSVLAVTYEDRFQLWTVGNYHYYLKQEIRIPRSVGQPPSPSLAWNTSHSLRLAAVSTGRRPRELSTDTTLIIKRAESLETMEFIFATASGSTVPPNDLGVVAVIDGRMSSSYDFVA